MNFSFVVHFIHAQYFEIFSSDFIFRQKRIESEMTVVSFVGLIVLVSSSVSDKTKINLFESSPQSTGN